MTFAFLEDARGNALQLRPMRLLGEAFSYSHCPGLIAALFKDCRLDRVVVVRSIQ